jgi:hypothetical protein
MLKPFLAPFAFVFALTPFTAVANEPEMPGEAGFLTDWQTMLAFDVDSGWQGNWLLESATVIAPSGSMQFPTAGHVLTIDYHGNYTLDYSTAYFLASIEVNTNAFTGSLPTVPPAGLMPAGIPANCGETAQFSGLISGKMFAPFDLDLDRLNPDGTPVYGLPWMEAALNPAASQKPEIACPGADVTVRSTGTMMPVGAGRGAVTDNGPVVPYDYEMDADLTTLIMRSRGVPSVRYVFRRGP